LKGPWNQGGGYRRRFGEKWEEELRKVVNKKWCCITELMDHVIEESKNIYQNTEYEDTFLIFHDGLSAWWEKEAQQYLASKGFSRRQLCCYDPTNIGTRYRGGVTGDSPELCSGLDRNGFADLSLSIAFHCSLSSIYPSDDIRAFRMGTPSQVEAAMMRCWMMEPTSQRIIQDITKFESVLDRIIEAQGCVVPDVFLRTGRRGDALHDDPRYQKLNGKGALKNKAINRQRKATIQSVQRPIHPDCEEAFNILLAGGHNIVEVELNDNNRIVHFHTDDDEIPSDSDENDD
jgi:hypothetical protein